MTTTTTDPVQPHLDAIRALVNCHVCDPRLIESHLFAIEKVRYHEEQIYARMDRPALPDQMRALKALASELGLRVSLPPSMSYGQAVIEGDRLAALDRRKRAIETQRRGWRSAVMPIRGGQA